EKIAAILRLERRVDESGKDVTFAEDSGNVVFATRNGTVKKTALNDFVNYRKAGIIAINLEEGNSLVNVELTDGSQDIILVTHDGMSIRFNESEMRNQGRGTIGVRGIKLREGDYVVALAVVHDDAAHLLVVSENGLGKRTAFSEYRIQSRAGIGIKTINCTEKTGKVVSATTVTDADELMIMTTGGQSVRIKVADVRETGRATQGVKLITLDANDLIQDISLIIPDDEESSDDASEQEGEPSPEEAGE
ncbi:MAG: DNA gyrase subunit A, partial [Akkermansia muciniphila]|nr:DNA gyrase subunit A [Akkermansia muciniphila]